MLHEIRISTKQATDKKSTDLLSEILSLGINSVTDVKTVKVYRLEGLSESAAQHIAQQLLQEDVYQTSIINKPLETKAACSIEVAQKPGVMNQEVNSIFKAAQQIGIHELLAADSSYEYHFFGNVTDQELQLITDRLLVNKTIQQIVTQKPSTLLVSGSVGPINQIPVRGMSDEQLIACAQENQLYLNLSELKAIQNYFNAIERDPYDAELETIAQTWSEHCYHKTFKAQLLVDGKKKEPLFKRLKRTSEKYARNVVSAFVDNSGAYEFYDGYAILGKVETHNSPSAIEPYGGAATGSGGVFRDIMGTGKGAKVIASTDMFCFAPPTLQDSELPPGCLHPKYLLKKVVAGVRDYGNRMGIPTNNGSVHFHKDFRAKPTVIVGAYGITKIEDAQVAQPKVGDRIFVVGGKTGRDGIHGATFSSGEMTSNTISVNASAVQIGNPIEEKRIADALLVCKEKNVIRALTDCGAGGFSSAIGEIGQDLGVHVELEKAPLKYTGLAPWEIWVSESQERMVCAIAPEHVDAFTTICAEYNVQATDVGFFTGDKKLQVTHNGNTVCDLDMEFLHNGLPQEVRVATHVQKEKKEMIVSTIKDLNNIYAQIMQHWNICSKESIVRQYDHGVQGINVLPPFSGEQLDGPNDATVLQPLFGKPYGMIIAHGMNPILNHIDPYAGSMWAIIEALANLVAVGGNYKDTALIDNFIWPYPDEQSLWDLDAAIEACCAAMDIFKIPFISGKDSLSSTYRYPNGDVLKIPPVLCISAFGKIPDITKTVTTDFKQVGSAIVLVGELDVSAMDGSVYEEFIFTSKITTEKCLPSEALCEGRVPQPNLQQLPQLFEFIHEQIKQDTILTCHDVSEGGIAVAIAEMCFGGNMGATINVQHEWPDLFMFNETPGCFVVEIAQDNLDILKNVPHTVLGITTDVKYINVKNNEKYIINIDVSTLKKAWQEPLNKVFV